MTHPTLIEIARKAWPGQNATAYAAELAKIIRIMNDCGLEVVPREPHAMISAGRVVVE